MAAAVFLALPLIADEPTVTQGRPLELKGTRTFYVSSDDVSLRESMIERIESSSPLRFHDGDDFDLGITVHTVRRGKLFRAEVNAYVLRPDENEMRHVWSTSHYTERGNVGWTMRIVTDRFVKEWKARQ
jgi:hypothetical protein